MRISTARCPATRGGCRRSSPGDSDCIRRARAYSPRIKLCAEALIAAQPKASGAITVTWDVVDGAVGGVAVVANETGDAEFATCVTRNVRSWKFGALTCSVPGYTWRIAPQ